jgi:two-component system OmpR family response regulator
MHTAESVVSKADILAGVWDEHFDGDPNIVEVYMHHLRRKIDEPYGKATIHTIRGVGYRISDTGG